MAVAVFAQKYGLSQQNIFLSLVKQAQGDKRD
jgi:hypothetical protein